MGFTQGQHPRDERIDENNTRAMYRLTCSITDDAIHVHTTPASMAKDSIWHDEDFSSGVSAPGGQAASPLQAVCSTGEADMTPGKCGTVLGSPCMFSRPLHPRLLHRVVALPPRAFMLGLRKYGRSTTHAARVGSWLTGAWGRVRGGIWQFAETTVVSRVRREL